MQTNTMYADMKLCGLFVNDQAICILLLKKMCERQQQDDNNCSLQMERRVSFMMHATALTTKLLLLNNKMTIFVSFLDGLMGRFLTDDEWPCSQLNLINLNALFECKCFSCVCAWKIFR